jgi:hypothetical protein
MWLADEIDAGERVSVGMTSESAEFELEYSLSTKRRSKYQRGDTAGPESVRRKGHA